MYWTLELAHHLEDAPWPATRDELIDYAVRSGAPLEVIENLNQLEEDEEAYESIEEIWPDYPPKDHFLNYLNKSSRRKKDNNSREEIDININYSPTKSNRSNKYC